MTPNGSFIKKISRIPYFGYPKNGNVGDEYLYELFCKYFPNVNTYVPSKSHSMLRSRIFTSLNKKLIIGGGSLLFSTFFLKEVTKFRKLGLTPILFGSGSRPISLLNEHEKVQWKYIFRNTDERDLLVRGTLTQEYFAALDIKSTVVGDPGLMFNLEFNQTPANGNYITIVPRLISSIEFALDESKRINLLVEVFNKRFPNKDGYKIVILSSSKQDIGISTLISSQISGSSISIYNKMDGNWKKLLSESSLVITTRMHPGIFSLSVGVPTLFMESRDKYHDTLSCFREGTSITEHESIDETVAKIESLLLLNHTKDERFTGYRKKAFEMKDVFEKSLSDLSK